MLEVRRSDRGPADLRQPDAQGLPARLFELEVPEIHSGTVEIKAIAREAGSRSKVAVASRQEGLDPVGATVGQRGARVQAVVAELAGEKIDVIPWSDDAGVFVANALSPAQVLSVDIDEEHRIASVTVPERMLSLAIGREGQNARLAARLTGWRIDIRSDVSVAEAQGRREPTPSAGRGRRRPPRRPTRRRRAPPPSRSRADERRGRRRSRSRDRRRPPPSADGGRRGDAGTERRRRGAAAGQAEARDEEGRRGRRRDRRRRRGADGRAEPADAERAAKTPQPPSPSEPPRRPPPPPRRWRRSARRASRDRRRRGASRPAPASPAGRRGRSASSSGSSGRPTAASSLDETGRAGRPRRLRLPDRRLPDHRHHQGRPQPGARDPAPGRPRERSSWGDHRTTTTIEGGARGQE